MQYRHVVFGLAVIFMIALLVAAPGHEPGPRPGLPSLSL